MSDKTQKTVRIKWVRSGIGFTHHQKGIVRSLGLKKLNQEVERPDTPQIRGLVASVPHLVTFVEAPKTPAWKLVPDYTVHPPVAAPAKPPETSGESKAVETETTAAPAPPVAAVAPPAKPAETVSESAAAEAEKAEVAASPVAPARESAEELKAVAPDAAEPKSGIERHAQIVRSSQEDSKPADPGGEGGES